MLLLLQGRRGAVVDGLGAVLECNRGESERDRQTDRQTLARKRQRQRDRRDETDRQTDRQSRRCQRNIDDTDFHDCRFNADRVSTHQIASTDRITLYTHVAGQTVL